MQLNPRFSALASLVGLAALSRLLPHPPNFTPIAAIALFGGARFSDRRQAFLVPLAAMALSDLFLGWHGTLPAVYAAFALTACLGLRLRSRSGGAPVAAAALYSTLLFFLLTNLAVWAVSAPPLYPRTPQGLLACYAAALPFLRNMLLANAFYTAALFCGFALAERRWPVLREAAA